MSKRRSPGDWVWLKPWSGFVMESNRLKAQIQPELIHEYNGKTITNWFPCMLDCGDPNCVEWSNLWTEEENGERYSLCHVSECQMLDEPWKEEGPDANNNS